MRQVEKFVSVNQMSFCINTAKFVKLYRICHFRLRAHVHQLSLPFFKKKCQLKHDKTKFKLIIVQNVVSTFSLIGTKFLV